MEDVDITLQDISSQDMQLFWDDVQVSINVSAHMVSPLGHIVSGLRIYYRPIIIITGIIGNVLSLITFSSGRLRKHTSSPYLCGLALTDTIFLMVLLIVWASHFRFDIYNAAGWCQTLTYLSYGSTFMPMWIYVAFNADRCLFVTCADRHPKWCTPLRSKLLVYSLLVIAIVVYLNISLLSGVIKTRNTELCVPLPRFSRQMALLDKMDAFVNLIVPYSALCALTVIIALHCYWRYRATTRLLPPTDLSLRRPSAWSPVERQMVRISIVLTATFLLLNLPSALLRLGVLMTCFHNNHMTLSYRTILWQQVFLHMYFTRFGVNIVVYSTCSQLFRRNLHYILTWPFRCLSGNRKSPLTRKTHRKAPSTSSVIMSNHTAQVNIGETTSV